MEERLQKLLSGAGICSRRKAEEYLAAGRVTVNGAAARIGDKADPERDRVEVDGVPLSAPAAHTYILLNKPRGYVTTLSDEKGRKTVADLLSGCPVRVWPVGRLDMDSEGLLLLTDDGEWTNRLTHPSHEVEKEYLVWVRGEAAAGAEALRTMDLLEGEPIRRPAMKVVKAGEGGGCLSVVIHEGKNRQVRRMCAAAGLAVTRLKRVREGTLTLGELRSGQWRYLTGAEAGALSL